MYMTFNLSWNNSREREREREGGREGGGREREIGDKGTTLVCFWLLARY